MRTRRFALVFAVALAAACADSTGDAAVATAEPAGAAGERAAAPPPDAAAVVAALPTIRLDGLWPGFDPAAVPVALFDGARTVLVAHPSPPEAFVAAEDIPGAVVFAGRHEAVRGNMPTEIGGVRTAAVLLDLLDGVTPERAAAVVTHERFHVFQGARHPEWSANELAIFQYPATDTAKLFDRRLETLALYRSVHAADAAQSECWLRTALLLRRKRMADLPPAVAGFERAIELNEGLARYIERRAAGLRTVVDMPANGFAPEEVRARGYVTGETLALMLDRYDPEWKTRIDDAAEPPSLDSLLWSALAERPETSCGFSAAERSEVHEAAIASVAATQARRDTALAAFDAQSGWTIRVVAGAGPLWPQSFDPMSITRVGPASLIHERMLRAGNERGFVDVFGVRALSTGYLEDPLMSGMREVRVAGIAERPAIASGEDIRVRIVAPGVELSFTDAHVDISGQEIVVRLQ